MYNVFTSICGIKSIDCIHKYEMHTLNVCLCIHVHVFALHTYVYKTVHYSKAFIYVYICIIYTYICIYIHIYIHIYIVYYRYCMYYTYMYIVYSIHDIHKYTWYTEECISQQRRCALESHTITTTGETQSSTVQLGLITNENAHLFKECTLHICSFIRCLVFMRVNVLLY